jgi:hypothetical protein
MITTDNIPDTTDNFVKTLTIDTEFKNLIPALLPEERAGLERSLLEEGCRDSIIVWITSVDPVKLAKDKRYGFCKGAGCKYETEYVPPDLWEPGDSVWRCPKCDYGIAPRIEEHIIIDGHNRYEICQKHGLPFGIRVMEFDNRDDVIEWIYQNQLSRRNLTDEKRTYLIGKQYEHRKNRIGDNQYTIDRGAQNEPTTTQTGKTYDTIAKENNVSRETVKRAEQYAKSVDNIAKTLGNETKEKILSGELETNKRDIIELSKLEPENQKAIVDGVLSGEYKDTKKAISSIKLQHSKKEIELAALDSNIELHIEHMDCIEWLKSLKADADLLITDPPYVTDVDNIEEFAQSWLPHALARVKSTGRAYVCIGAYPDELKAYLNIDPGHLELCQVLVWTYRNTLGPSPKDMYKQNWQAILYYKGVEAPDLNCPVMVEQFSVQDINAPDNRHGYYERWHAWQKPDELAERLIRHSTNAGDLVIDPFAGTGTFLIAATKLGREAIGCDNDPEMIKISQSRAGVLA